MGTNYIELHCHTEFSLLDGASTVEALMQQAAAQKMLGLAITDHDTLGGVIPFVKAARANGIHPIVGAELTLERGHHLTVLVENARGWENLSDLVTIGRMNV